MKNTKTSVLTLVILLALLFLFRAEFITSLILVIIGYILHELFWADHIKFNIRKDQKAHFTNGEYHTISLNPDGLKIPDELVGKNKTLFLEVNIKSRISGFLFDPFIEIRAGEKVDRQYFERGLSGVRYLNISATASCSEKIEFVWRKCRIVNKTAKLIAFSNPDLESKKILVLSPHPDDAEISAYGLYRNNNSLIVTLTAGESEADFYKPLTSDITEASKLKGSLRVFNSTTVPYWNNKSNVCAINLGYFDGTLKSMHDSPEETFISSSGVSELGFFRDTSNINCLNLATGKPSWDSLISDLTALIAFYKPDYIVTPHMTYDKHSDHKFTTIAAQQALVKSNQTAKFLYYINHLEETDEWPYGPAMIQAGLPPVPLNIDTVLSIPLSKEIRIDKMSALEMMHDLRTDTNLKAKFRLALQTFFLGRKQPFYYKSSFYRKAVKSNELFFLGHN